MKVITAKTAGFCFGVERAVNTVYEQIEAHKGEVIYTYGPIIHNDEVIKDLEKKGVTVLRTEEELEHLDAGVVIIRSHGVEKRIYEKLNEKGITIVDATCPFVKKIHQDRRERKCARARDRYHRKSGSSGGTGNPRMGGSACERCAE